MVPIIHTDFIMSSKIEYLCRDNVHVASDENVFDAEMRVGISYRVSDVAAGDVGIMAL